VLIRRDIANILKASLNQKGYLIMKKMDDLSIIHLCGEGGIETHASLVQ
jgi:hypothetical protein